MKYLFKPQAQPVEPLPATEKQVLKLQCQNLSNQKIGEILGIKLPTVKPHVSHIFQKQGVKPTERSQIIFY